MNSKMKTSSGLWARDFTIITLGSAVSMLGNSMLGFAMSLFVLDFTGTTQFYALFLFLFTLPQIIAPILAGPLVDRFSRRKTIYLLDFLSSTCYGVFGLLILFGWFRLSLLAVMALLIGTINSVYQVAFSSFYPMLIPDGHYSKAYSVSTTLETLSATMIVVATLMYNAFGIAPLMLISCLCFFVAALFETGISDVEHTVPNADKPYRMSSFLEDIKAGMRYLKSEKGLLIIVLYTVFAAMAGGVSNVVSLPWFRENCANGEFIYMSVWVFMVVGRVMGSMFQYKYKLPAPCKFGIALTGFITASALEGVYLFTPVWVMRILCFVIGVFTSASHNIQRSGTQLYVPNDKKGRFNGASLMLKTVGTLTGQLLAGAAITAMPLRGTLAIFMFAAAVAALALIGFGQRHVQPILNRNA